MLKRVECPKCSRLVGRILSGVAEFDCRRDHLRVLAGVSIASGEVVICHVDAIPKETAQSA